MEEKPLGFGVSESGDDVFADAAPVAINVLFDGKSSLRRRPGLVALTGAPSTAFSSYGISGVYATTTGGHLVAIDEKPGRRRFWRITGGSAQDISAPASAELRGTSRPVFAETEGLLLVAGGREVQKLTLTDPSTPSARLGGPPPLATHVVSNASRLLVNRVLTPTNEVAFSAVGTGTAATNFEEWSDPLRSGTIRAVSRPDPVVALHESKDELWLFGSTSTQVFVPDPNLVYAPAMQSERGCLAPYSVVRMKDGVHAWIDHEKDVVLGTGRMQKSIGGPIRKTLGDAPGLSGTFGYRVVDDQFECLVLSCDEDGRAFCYQLEGGWSTWQGWNGTNWTKFNVLSHHLHRSTKQNIVGTRDGKVALLSTSAATDLGDPIRVLCQTGFKSRGSDNRKECHAVSLSFTRPNWDGSTIYAQLRYRNEDGNWRGPIRVALDKAQQVKWVRPMGSYRRRQWEISYEATEEVILSSATEHYTVRSD